MMNTIHTLFNVMAAYWPALTPADWRALAILVAFAWLFTLEVRCGYRKLAARSRRQSYLSNIGTFLLNDTLMSLMSVSSLLLLAERFSGFGLLADMPDSALKFAVSFLLFDGVLYAWHRLNHSFDGLWMFHKVHHSDPDMNVSTAFRLHFVEVVFTTVIKAAFVLLTGVGAKLLLANEALITLFVMFHHANVRLRGECWLAWLFVVPALHRRHHSTLRREHDSNYGAVFSFWDRLFRSFATGEPATLGLRGVTGMNALHLLRYGLTRTWTPRPQPAGTAIGNPQFIERMIAEAAYYRAEKRGFAPGNDYLDWIEAEKEIRSKFGLGC